MCYRQRTRIIQKIFDGFNISEFTLNKRIRFRNVMKETENAIILQYFPFNHRQFPSSVFVVY